MQACNICVRGRATLHCPSGVVLMQKLFGHVNKSAAAVQILSVLRRLFFLAQLSSGAPIDLASQRASPEGILRSSGMEEVLSLDKIPDVVYIVRLNPVSLASHTSLVNNVRKLSNLHMQGSLFQWRKDTDYCIDTKPKNADENMHGARVSERVLIESYTGRDSRQGFEGLGVIS